MRRNRATQILVWKVALVACVLIAANLCVFTMGHNQNAGRLSRSHLRVHYVVEEGLDEDLYGFLIRYAAREFGLLLNIPDVTVQYRGMFPDDDKDLYERGDPDAFGPAGFGSNWPSELRPPALDAGENDLLVAYLKGSGRGFSGLSDYGQRIGVLVNATTGFFSALDTLWHELGHAAGLVHRSDSPVMGYDDKTILDFLGTAALWDEPGIISALENGTLSSMEGADLEWVAGEAFAYGVREGSLEVVTRDRQYLFCRELDNWLSSVVLRGVFWIEGGVERRVEAGVYRLDVMPESLLGLFSPEERRYLSDASAGDLLALPPVPTGVDLDYNSIGEYLRVVLLKSFFNPVFIILLGFITLGSLRFQHMIRCAPRKEECDDGLF